MKQELDFKHDKQTVFLCAAAIRAWQITRAQEVKKLHRIDQIRRTLKKMTCVFQNQIEKRMH